ncbi:PX domain-containing protein [Spathaspora sp. JA1]|nr:PX domain-containing protein [Spathaspora sp. JA1]
MTHNGSVATLPPLTSTQEHFLKKYLLEIQLVKELHLLNDANCCQLLGAPFKVATTTKSQPPLLSFFFSNFITTFPFITNNPIEDQRKFWQDTLQPFITSFNTKPISESQDRVEHTTKRKQVNTKILSGLLIFFNSMITTKNELSYWQDNTRLKPTDVGKLDGMLRNPESQPHHKPVGLTEYASMKFVNNLYVNIVAVRSVDKKSFTLFDDQHNYEFIIQVVGKQDDKYSSYFITRHYSQFSNLHTNLTKQFPGIIKTQVNNLPSKSKHDEGTSNTLVREKLRLALRGYLRSLITHADIIHYSAFITFITHDRFTRLAQADINDYNDRIKHESTLIDTQYQFQQQTTKVMVQLTADFEAVKHNLVMNPQAITEIFQELGKTSDVHKLSPVLNTFNEWCKLQISSTIYHTFLSQDNSNEWFSKCRKFHKLFPYSLVYGILRFTNPVKIVSKVIDLLLVEWPSFSWSGKKQSHNLLSMIFIMLLDEDLNDYEKELSQLREGKLSDDDDKFACVFSRFDQYIELSYIDIGHIKTESIEQARDIFDTVLSTQLIQPPLPKPIIEQITSTPDLHLAFKQYWQLQVRKRDKNLFKQLWLEPELTRLIKDFFTIFYQPLMEIFGKCDVHLVFSSFHKFMDDLMNLVTNITNEGIYYMSSFEIYDSLKSLLDKHEDILWEFLHNMYCKDDQQLFLKLIQWMEKYLVMIRLKFVNPQAVTVTLSSSVPIDHQLFLQQLNCRISKIIEKRRLFKEYTSTTTTTVQEKIDEDWKVMNDGIFGNSINGQDIGVDTEDLQEFNELTKLENLQSKQTPNLVEQELLSRLAKLDNGDDLGTSELDKLESCFESQLKELFQNIDI